MKKSLYTLLVLSVLLFTFKESYSQVTRYTFTRPKWTVGFGATWNLATNDAYGRANYASQDQILKENYGMRWGYGGYIVGKYSPGKKRMDRLFLGADYKGMKNADMDKEGNSTKYDIVTIDAGYEFLFYGTSFFRSYYGAGITGNIIRGSYTPKTATMFNVPKTFASTFRVGMELKAGLEFIFNNSRRNFGINLGAKYNLLNLFNDENEAPRPGQTEELSLNDGSGDYGPGFKRYIGIVSIDLGLNIYPDVKKVVKRP